MTPVEFHAAFDLALDRLQALVDALDQNSDLAGSLSLDDFMLLRDLTRDYLMFRGA